MLNRFSCQRTNNQSLKRWFIIQLFSFINKMNVIIMFNKYVFWRNQANKPTCILLAASAIVDCCFVPFCEQKGGLQISHIFLRRRRRRSRIQFRKKMSILFSTVGLFRNRKANLLIHVSLL